MVPLLFFMNKFLLVGFNMFEAFLSIAFDGKTWLRIGAGQGRFRMRMRDCALRSDVYADRAEVQVVCPNGQPLKTKHIGSYWGFGAIVKEEVFCLQYVST